MARGIVDINMIIDAQNGDLNRLTADINTFGANLKFVDPVTGNNIVSIIANKNASLLTNLYSINEDLFKKQDYEVRLAYDIGSGATKTGLYIVQKSSNSILKTINTLTTSYGYQACIDTSSNNTLSNTCIDNGLTIMQNIAKMYSINCSIIDCAGDATAWARNAVNAQDYILNYLRPNNFNIFRITQAEEGRIGFYSLINNPSVKVDPSKVMVWDIGGGSFQLSTYNSSNQVYVYNGPYGSANFKTLLQNNNLTSPMGADNLAAARDLAAINVITPLQADSTITTKAALPTTIVYAIGAGITAGLTSLISKSSYTKNCIDFLITQFYSTDNTSYVYNATEFKQNYPNINTNFYNDLQSNLLLWSSIMEGAGIKEIIPQSTKATDAIVLDIPLETVDDGIIQSIWDF